jgi:hypothetical protein
MHRMLVALAAATGLSIALAAGAGTEENAEDFMALHKVESPSTRRVPRKTST